MITMKGMTTKKEDMIIKDRIDTKKMKKIKETHGKIQSKLKRKEEWSLQIGEKRYKKVKRKSRNGINFRIDYLISYKNQQ